MKLVTEQRELEEVLNCLKQDIPNCLYIYIDLKKYGLENPHITLWISRKDGKLNLVVMKYHDGFQLYSIEQTWNRQEVLQLIEDYDPDRILGNEASVCRLECELAEKYKLTHGAILCRTQDQLWTRPQNYRCVIASREDIPEIADLMLTEPEFGTAYSKAELIAQLEERYRTKMGRSIIFRDQGEIVGHMATFAEIDGIAVLSGSVVKNAYRQTDCYDAMCDEFMDLLIRQEHKVVFFASTVKRQIKCYSRLFKICAQYGKLTKITETREEV